MSEAKALVVRTVDEERQLVEKQRLKAERAQLVRVRRQEELKALVSSVKLDSARIVNLRRHMFKTEEELRALQLTNQQIAIVRQFEEPKKATAFGVESAAKLIEAETRAQGESKKIGINVEKLIVKLPEKSHDASLPAPKYVDVETK